MEEVPITPSSPYKSASCIFLHSGLSGRPGDFTPEAMKLMTKYTDCPIIFSLSNPLIRAEATAAEAYSTLKVYN